MQRLVTRIGTDEDCAMAGFWAVRYFSVPDSWRIDGYIGRMRDGFRCRWGQELIEFATVGEAESWIQSRSGYCLS